MPHRPDVLFLQRHRARIPRSSIASVRRTDPPP
jgi:hypothetical protein